MVLISTWEMFLTVCLHGVISAGRHLRVKCEWSVVIQTRDLSVGNYKMWRPTNVLKMKKFECFMT